MIGKPSSSFFRNKVTYNISRYDWTRWGIFEVAEGSADPTGGSDAAPDIVSAATNPDWKFVISPEKIQHPRHNLNPEEKARIPN